MTKKYNGMKVLELDIETAPNMGYFWGLFGQNIGINQIESPGYTLCFAAKWQHERKVIFKSIYHDGLEDMLSTMHELLDEADVVVHYNGKKFDMPTLNREFVLNELSPPSPYDQIDLYWVVRSNFRFVSNKLDFVAQQLGLGNKVKHKGMELWKDCMAGVDSAWNTMRRYNVQDVRLLSRLYSRLQPWIKNHPNRGLWMPVGDDHICPNCGSKDLRFKGYKKTKVMEYKQHKCNNCGKYSRERFAKKPTRKDILR